MKNFVKQLMRKSPIGDHFVNFFLEIYVAFVHAVNVPKCKRKYKNKKGLKINFGSGSYLKLGFVNLDFTDTADVRLDLRKDIPLKDACVELIFSEHFVEHLSYPEGVERHFNECYRILEPGGEIYISVPDTEWPLKDYVNSGTSYLNAAKDNNWHHEDCTTFMEHINHHFRQRWRGFSYSHFENHRFAWDFETMNKKLKEMLNIRYLATI
jgi:predicted SAM-dependent methyltransferase